MRVMQILHAHNVMLNVLRRDLQRLHLKLDRMDSHLHKEVICVNAFQAVARQVTRRRQELAENDEITDEELDAELVQK